MTTTEFLKTVDDALLAGTSTRKTAKVCNVSERTVRYRKAELRSKGLIAKATAANAEVNDAAFNRM